MTIAVEEGVLVAQSTQNITLQVGGTKLVMTPSDISFIAPVIQLNLASAGTASASPIEAHSTNPDSTKTKTYGAIQNDLLANEDDL